MATDPAERLAVALDVPALEPAVQLAAQLAGKVGVFKIGLELFTAYGPAAVQAAASFGAGIFLDLKVHDIPRTAAAAVAAAGRLGARYVTLHALGGPAMIAAAREESERLGAHRPKLLAVTILTSHGQDEVWSIGLAGSPQENVLRLARMAVDAGADGIVASAQEAAPLRRALGGWVTIVTPGIRPAGAAAGDQVRTATPADAIRDGADLIVVGRPIVASHDPAGAADAILDEIRAAI